MKDRVQFNLSKSAARAYIQSITHIITLSHFLTSPHLRPRGLKPALPALV